MPVAKKDAPTKASEAKAAPAKKAGRQSLKKQTRETVKADVRKPVPEGMTRYTVLRALGAPDGVTYIKGEVVDLYDDEAKYFNKHKAIGIYLTDDDEEPDLLPKPVRNKRRDASKHKGAPTPLSDSDTLEVDASL